MDEIVFINRVTRQREQERVYGQRMIELFYGNGWFSRVFSFLFLPLFARISFLSWVYGQFQKSRLSRWKVKPFVHDFQVDASEFLKPLDAFTSFNDFFIRKLQPNARPCVSGSDVAVLPADGRYLVFQNLSLADGFWVKDKLFDLETFLGDSKLAKQYENGAMVIARLCPVDYHRFHFPCANVPGASRLINGPLYSVNPMALKRNIAILSENKRVITPLTTEFFGVVQYVEIGATFVGSIQQTFESGRSYGKGEEKGYFEFGGSCLILLFEPGKIVFDQDLIEASLSKIETRGLLGQSLGRSI
ncbi:MAG: phosphatidylserine decarboxylase [Rhabdochlamydiaceae bacterium]|nr:phosphatidylserine decarboxylase [Rhabdochlamydiaceae bacterium]